VDARRLLLYTPECCVHKFVIPGKFGIFFICSFFGFLFFVHPLVQCIQPPCRDSDRGSRNGGDQQRFLPFLSREDERACASAFCACRVVSLGVHACVRFLLVISTEKRWPDEQGQDGSRRGQQGAEGLPSGGWGADGEFICEGQFPKGNNHRDLLVSARACVRKYFVFILEMGCHSTPYFALAPK